ncbi:hypothetical protein Tco_1454834 [Tanacetum coccineum]
MREKMFRTLGMNLWSKSIVRLSYDNLFTLKVHHSGYFTSPPDKRNNNVLVDWYDLVDSELFSINEYDSLLEDLGFKDGRILFSHFRVRGKSLDEGFAPLMFGEDVLSLLWHVPRDIEIEVYVENGVSLVEKQMMKVRLAKGNGVLIEEIDDVDDLIVWQQDNYHRDNKEEETALLFAELDQLLEHVVFLNVELRESVVGVDPPIVAVDALVISVNAPIIALEEEIQRPRKRKREMEDESAYAIVTFGRPNKSRKYNLADKTKKGMEDKAMEANGLGFHV